MHIKRIQTLMLLMWSVVCVAWPLLSLPLMAAPVKGVITGKMMGEEWLQAPVPAKQVYCEKAYRAFRGSASQSYIISSNVQAMTPSGLCQRLDQFYSYEVNLDTPLESAAGIAPLLFADQALPPE